MLRTSSLFPVLLFAAPLASQTVGGGFDTLHTFPGSAAGGHFGSAVAGVDDVNADGVPDFAVGAPAESPGGLAQAGAVYVLSGADGSLLHRFTGTQSGEALGFSVAGPGDVDRDGHADILAGAPFYTNVAPSDGRMCLYSGRDGLVLVSYFGILDQGFYGWSVSGAGDINADGWLDFLVGEPGDAHVNDGRVYVYDGATGGLMRVHQGSFGEYVGISVAGAGDVNADGRADYLYGMPGRGGAFQGAALLHSGLDGAVIRAFTGTADSDYFGAAVAGIGDADGDAVADLAIGATGGPASGGYVSAYSGASGALLWRRPGAAAGDTLGASVAGAGDVDADGVPDVIAGAPGSDPGGKPDAGAAVLLRGSDGALSFTIAGSRAGIALGSAVSGAGDLSADTRADFLVGSPLADPAGLTDAGLVSLHGFAPFLSLSSATISASSGVDVQVLMDFPGSEAFKAWILLASLTGTGPTSLLGLEVPLTPDNLYQLMLAGNPPAVFPSNLGGLDAGGDAGALVRSLPGLAAHVGRTVWLAAVSYDPLGPLPRLSSVARPLTAVP
ncbi:MAG: hypothetical protein EYC70_10245 [Planctomycetota bacterium]|nr:MAG: hypothetical protein EYC70_10245 [Planctomycetota bacterium]